MWNSGAGAAIQALVALATYSSQPGCEATNLLSKLMDGVPFVFSECWRQSDGAASHCVFYKVTVARNRNRAVIEILGYQSGEVILCDMVRRGGTVRLVFNKSKKAFAYPDLKRGDLLLELRLDRDVLAPKWHKIQPNLDPQENACKGFKPLDSLP